MHDRSQRQFVSRAASAHKACLVNPHNPARAAWQRQLSSRHAHVYTGRSQPHRFSHTPCHVAVPVQGHLIWHTSALACS